MTNSNLLMLIDGIELTIEHYGYLANVTICKLSPRIFDIYISENVPSYIFNSSMFINSLIDAGMANELSININDKNIRVTSCLLNG